MSEPFMKGSKESIEIFGIKFPELITIGGYTITGVEVLLIVIAISVIYGGVWLYEEMNKKHKIEIDNLKKETDSEDQ